MKSLYSKMGFTLIEVIVSLAILSIVAISLLSIFTSSFSIISSMGRKTKAMAEAQQVMDTVYKSGSITSSSIQDIINNETDKANIAFSLIDSFQVTTGINMHKVTITVYYDNRTKTVSLESLIP